MQIDISVIIPTFKPQKYIEDCLLSLQNQKLNPKAFEIILILNGCYNPWFDTISEFINCKLSRMNIRLIHSELGGVSNARNIGIDNAKGKYIAFIDDDDYVSPMYLELLLGKAEDNTMVLSDALSFIDGKNGFDETYSMHKTYLKCYDKSNPSIFDIRHLLNGPCMKLIPHQAIGDIRFDTRFRNGEDSLFIYNVLRNINHFKFAGSQAIYYRRFREGSAVTRKDTIWYIIRNAFALNNVQLGIYLRNISRYNFFYTALRLLASFKGAAYRILGIGN